MSHVQRKINGKKRMKRLDKWEKSLIKIGFVFTNMLVIIFG